MLIPALILLIVITAYPFITSISLSFFDYSFLKTGFRFIGLKNYTDIIADGKFMSSLGFTLIWTIINVAAMTGLGFATAILMRQRFAGREFIKGTMLVPWVLPQVVTGYIFGLMLAEDAGIINVALKSLGLMHKGFSWFSTPRFAIAAVLIANIWRGFPFITLMVYAKMQSLSISFLEAPKIDGAGGLQIFRYIIIPLVRPVTVTCMLLTFIWSFNAFDIIKVMTGGGPLESTATLSLLLQREAFSYLEISRACTMAVMMFIILLLCVGIILLCGSIFRRVSRHEAKEA